MDTKRSFGEETGFMAYKTFQYTAGNVFFCNAFVAYSMMFKLTITNELFVARWTGVCPEMIIDVHITLFSRCKSLCTNIACEFEIFYRLNFQHDLWSGHFGFFLFVFLCVDLLIF